MASPADADEGPALEITIPEELVTLEFTAELLPEPCGSDGVTEAVLFTLPVAAGFNVPLMLTEMKLFALPEGILAFSVTAFPLPDAPETTVALPLAVAVQVTFSTPVGTASFIAAFTASLLPVFTILSV